MGMREDHMQAVAYRHKLKSIEEFWKYLAKCGWADDDIAKMWKIAKGKDVTEGVSK